MRTKGQLKCFHCGVWFHPHPRNRHHQRYCAKPECRAASKRASQRKWCRKNPDYFRGPENVQRVRQWRAAHPGYWQRGAAEASCVTPDALQDILMSQGFDRESVTLFRHCLQAEFSQPLQDVLSAQQSAIVGLVSFFSGEALQDDIVRILMNCYERGQRIGGMVPWMHKQEIADERKRTDRAPAAAPGTPAVQLG